MTREKFMQEARLTAHKILESKENGIMNLVQQAYAEGRRSAETTFREGEVKGQLAMKEAVDRILDMMSYDANGLFHIHNEKMAADMIRKMSKDEVFEAATKIDEWERAQIGEYRVGLVVRDPLGRACVITKIFTGQSAGVMGMYHVLYAGGDNGRWPSGTKFEALEEDGGTLSDLSEAIAGADQADREETV